MPQISVNDNHRFTMQISPVAKARLMWAAALQQMTLKDFLLQNSLSAADAVIERAERIKLSEQDTQIVIALLDNPREPNPNMVAILKSRTGR